MIQPKIIATSDLHGHLPEIPECDILIIAGDVCPMYSHAVQDQYEWLDTNFRLWLSELPVDYIFGIAGNHDFVFEKWPDRVEALTLPWDYYKDEAVTVAGNKLWGSPWVPNLARWAFHNTDEGLDARMAEIPEDVDIVVSHGPPFGFRDYTVPKFGSVHAGFPGTNDMLERVKPIALVCGHIHEGYGTEPHPSGAWVYNVAHQTENYDAINSPIEIKLDGSEPAQRRRHNNRTGYNPLDIPGAY